MSPASPPSAASASASIAWASTKLSSSNARLSARSSTCGLRLPPSSRACCSKSSCSDSRDVSKKDSRPARPSSLSRPAAERS
eukprot:7206807-Prymnesium_polylepis.2